MAWTRYERIDDGTGLVTHLVEFDGPLAQRVIDAWDKRGPYTVQETDIDTDKRTKLALENRRKEYPTTSQLVVALYQKEAGNAAEFNRLQSKLASVDAKYPLP